MQHLKHRKASDEEALEHFKKKEKRSRKKRSITSYEERLEAANKNIKVKSIIDFEAQNSSSIKSMAIKKIQLSKLPLDLLRENCSCFPRYRSKAMFMI